MPGTTDTQGWGYPLPGEVFRRQAIQDMADDMTFSLGAVNVGRLAALDRTRGLLGHNGTQSFTNGTPGFIAWTVDHLDNWSAGGQAITSTQGPTLPTGLYLFNLSALVTSWSATYARIEVSFDGFIGRRTLSFEQKTLRLTAPVRIPAGAPQQVRVRVAMTGATGGSTISILRTNDESSPRLSWVQLAAG
jgi:hypothetical protein